MGSNFKRAIEALQLDETRTFTLRYTPQRWSKAWWLYKFWPPRRREVAAWLKASEEIIKREVFKR